MSFIKINVIDEYALRDGIRGIAKKQLKKNEMDDYHEENIVDLIPSSTTLILSFKKINKIENIVGFDNLQKLCLDNNCIETISNLSHLKNLMWLDLSFNKISKIEGMENLINLEDLSLYNNLISDVQGLENCKSLKCLSLGNNDINSIENILPLRFMKELRVLALSGNPINTGTDYKYKILAYFDNLSYLDYLLADPHDRAKGKELFKDELKMIEEVDMDMKMKQTKDNLLQMELKQLKEIGILFTHTFFENLFQDDKHMMRIKNIPGTVEQIERYQTLFQGITDEYKKSAVERYSQKVKEISIYKKLKDDLMRGREIDEQSYKTVLESSITNAESILNQPHGTVRYDDWRPVVTSLQNDFEKVCDNLMAIELRLVENLDALIDQYEDKLMELKLIDIDAQTLYFREIEDLEEKFLSHLRTMLSEIVEKVANDEFPEETYDEEALGLLIDKDICLSAASSSHEFRLSKILYYEEECRKDIIQSYSNQIMQEKDNLFINNRARVLDILGFSQKHRPAIERMTALEDDEDVFT